jgi:hypothetical protein
MDPTHRVVLFACLSACTTSITDEPFVDEGEPGRDLGDCGGSVEDDVPEPFASWFRCADLVADGGTLAVNSTSLPPHPSPYYEETDDNYVAFDDRGGDWWQNPNTLASQDLLLRFDLEPVAKGLTITDDMVDGSAGTHDEEYRGEFQGVGLDGTALFTGVAAPGDDIAEEELTFDLYEGHPTNLGVYHHHGANPAALAVLAYVGEVSTTVPGEAEIELYGVMCDGTFVLGCPELDGSAPDEAEFDAQNGHVGDLVDRDGTTLFAGRYHVHACAALGRTYTPEIQYYEGQCL